jgi:membrane dipeptidase
MTGHTVGYDIFTREEIVTYLAESRRFFEAHADKVRLIETVYDVFKAKGEGRLGVMLDFQGTNCLGGDLEYVSMYYKLGVRSMLLAYNADNLVGGGCYGKGVGLTPFGREVVREMNRVGMLVDGSHTGHRTTMEAMEITTSPFIFSHSNAHALCKIGRNITDDQIKACAQTGGVIGINGVGIFLRESGTDISSEALVAHIDYMVQLVGPQHVGLGLDYLNDQDWLVGLTRKYTSHYTKEGGYDDAAKEYLFAPPEVLPEVTEGLVKCGYSETDIRGILGGNFLRVARQVWK